MITDAGGRSRQGRGHIFIIRPKSVLASLQTLNLMEIFFLQVFFLSQMMHHINIKRKSLHHC